jgi:hypothetical protein
MRRLKKGSARDLALWRHASRPDASMPASRQWRMRPPPDRERNDHGSKTLTGYVTG